MVEPVEPSLEKTKNLVEKHKDEYQTVIVFYF